MFSSLLLAAFAAPLANAHATLQYPPARAGQAQAPGQKLTPYADFMDVINTEGPDCGSAKGNIGADPGPIQATFAPGQQIDVQWQMTIPHDADRTNYGVRIALHYGPGDSYAQNILLDNYDAGTGAAQTITASVTLPAGKTSENAVLQWMWAAQSDGGFYLGCSDISIVEGGGDPASDPADPNGPGTAPPGTTDPNGQGTGAGSTGAPQGPGNGSGDTESPQSPPNGAGSGGGSTGSPQDPPNGGGSGNGNGGGSGANDPNEPTVIRITTKAPSTFPGFPPTTGFNGNNRFGGNNGRYGGSDESGYGGYGSDEGGYGGYGSEDGGWGGPDYYIDMCFDCNQRGMQFCAFAEGAGQCLPVVETQFEYACGQEIPDQITGGAVLNGVPVFDCESVNADGTIDNLDDLADTIAAWGILFWVLVILGNVIPLCICGCICVCLYKVFVQKDNPSEIHVHQSRNNYVEFEDDRHDRRGRRGRRVQRMSTRV